MKTPKAGQLCTINHVVYRAYHKTNGCEGCAFAGNFITCPAIINNKTGKPAAISCYETSIILKKC